MRQMAQLIYLHFVKNDRYLQWINKLPSSGCEEYMITENMELLGKDDTVKFVCGSQEDLLKALDVIQTYDLTNRCHVYLSPVFGP